jgi:DNA-directed RNA polymerase sigma subunit (sigma70/sigma32)
MPATATASNDQELLRRFVASQSDEAFRALVERHLGMVLRVAKAARDQG